MSAPERLLPAYESLARVIRSILREELAPIIRGVAELQAARGEREDPEGPAEEGTMRDESLVRSGMDPTISRRFRRRP